MNEIIFSICITSYNRVSELSRMLKSVDSVKYRDSLEIIVSEDKSPRKDEIQKVVEDFQKCSEYRVVFNTNTDNLGYDRNLGKLKSLSSGKYIIYMSDDDMFNPGTLDDYMDYVLQNDCALAFEPFTGVSGFSRKYRNSFYISPGEVNAAKHINDAILFSGLTFKKDVIDEYDSERFLNTYYFQVYMFLSTLYKHGAYYVNIPLVSCVGDGENGFGLSDSSVKNDFLANRKSIFSKLEFHRGLFKVIDMFDEENRTNVKKLHAHEYTIHRLPDMCQANIMGKETYKTLLDMQESVNAILTFEYKIFKAFIFLFGGKITMALFSIPRKCLIKFRELIVR